ncbi:hypothetical protein B0O99DRAFT_646402 [Bisporella sp. PMI_857]|nr:hypothetical protein B0O99DRAFT_646402 [Bisporella sp. PMI_857]
MRLSPMLAALLLSSASTFASPLTYRSDLKTILTGCNITWSASTVMSFPGTDYFTNATHRWTIAYEPTYAAAISPANEEDVAAAVKLAIQNGISFLATGGRHGFTPTLGELQQGLAIDLSQLNSFSADADSGTATLGGAARIGDFQEQLYAAGLMLPGGSCACPGYNGLSVGGGIGRYMGSFGLVTDRLLSARVVTATGKIVEVSKTKNRDLFWALRGAGANFGIITSATYQAEKMADHDDGYVLTADLYFTPNSTAAYFAYLEKVAPHIPSNVAGLHITQWNGTTGQAQLLTNWVWFGPEQEGRDFISQFIDLGPSLVQNFKYIPWTSIYSVSLAGYGDTALCIDGLYQWGYASNIKSLSGSTFQSTFESLMQWYAENPGARNSATNLEVFPNDALIAVPNDETAYPWRDTTAYLTVTITVDDPSNQTLLDAGDSFARGLQRKWNETSGYAAVGGATYINYASGSESLEARYGADKLPRLAKLKKKWDPSNVFAYNNPLPTSYPGGRRH